VLIGMARVESLDVLGPAARVAWQRLLTRLCAGVRCVRCPDFRVSNAQRFQTEWRGLKSGGMAGARPVFRWLHSCRWRVVRVLHRCGGVVSVAELADIAPWMEEADRVRAALAAANDGLVRSMVRRVRGNAGEPEDALQEARLNLLRCIDLFDWTMGWQFSTYAYPSIRTAVLRYRTHAARHAALEPVQLDLALERPRRPGIDPEALPDLRRPLESPGLPLAGRAQYVLGRRFGLFGHGLGTLDAIGEERGLSKERVRQIDRVVLGRLRAVLGVEHDHRAASVGRHPAVREQSQDQRCGRRRRRRIDSAVRLPPADRCG